MMRFGFLATPLAIVRPSGAGATPEAVDQSLTRLMAKHGDRMSDAERAQFAAAHDIERAAARWRAGRLIGMAGYLLRSLVRWPRMTLHGHPPRIRPGASDQDDMWIW